MALTPPDDYLIHQTERLIAASGSGQQNWYEHGWFFLIPPVASEPLIEQKFQVHPNTGMLYGYLSAVYDGTQFNFRAGRELSSRLDLEVGPLRQRVVEPHASYRVELGPNEQSVLSMDVEVEVDVLPGEWPLMQYENDEGIYHVQQHVPNMGHVVRGELTIGAKRFDLANYAMVRDHCWGYRTSRVPAVHTWMPVFFDKRRLLLWHTEDRDGTPMYDMGQIFDGDTVHTIAASKVEFDEHDGNASRFEWTFTDSSGAEHRLVANKAFDYGLDPFRAGWTGEMEDDFKGSFQLDGDQFDARISAAEPGRRGLGHYYCRFELDGEPGYGLLAHYLLARARGGGSAG